MIPKIIWQTYKTPYKDLPNYIKEAINSWKNLNPEYEYKYFDDSQIDEFVLKEFGQDWYNLFINVPLGVMKADIWRYMVLYKYGGVYADIDTICNKSIKLWVDDKYDLIVSDDGDGQSFCQLTFAANKNHIILKTVLDYIFVKLQKADYNSIDFVHQTTGVVIWSKAIRDVLKFKPQDPFFFYNAFNVSKNAQHYKFFCFKGEKSNTFYDGAITHIAGSINHWDNSYISWQNEAKRFLKNDS